MNQRQIQKGEIYRYQTPTGQRLVKVGRLCGAFVQMREPKGGYRFGRANLLVGTPFSREDFARLDH